MIRLAVLLSGRGSNFAAIHQAIVRRELGAQIVAVISNRADAPGIARAREWGYDAHVIDNRDFPNRTAHEQAIVRVLDSAKPDYIVLAGYMRLLSPSFVAKYRGRILNIHPSLLPAFPGVDAQAQAIAAGARTSGCTVHFVDEGLDSGPVILQREVDVRDDDTVETLSARILEQEHIAYVEALKKLT
ncbi:MAG TPA: phosphoribosylglycinamide formyltransferase [Thermoanaerobaculia bacterium]|nr:phosphoribosylglycinamide formyltransferase [Thermoanaerobaculia bacterium]